jgi:hypothetical protein
VPPVDRIAAFNKTLYNALQPGFYTAIPFPEPMEQKPAPTEDHSLGRELRVGLAGLAMAAGLITIFLLIMSYLATIVHHLFGVILPFFIDKG